MSLRSAILKGKDHLKQPSFFRGGGLPSSKLTWQWKIPMFNRECIFNWSIFHCHVSSPEVSSLSFSMVPHFFHRLVSIRGFFFVSRWHARIFRPNHQHKPRNLDAIQIFCQVIDRMTHLGGRNVFSRKAWN